MQDLLVPVAEGTLGATQKFGWSGKQPKLMVCTKSVAGFYTPTRVYGPFTSSFVKYIHFY